MQRQTREIRLQKSQTQCMGKYSCMARDKISFGTCDTLLQKLSKPNSHRCEKTSILDTLKDLHCIETT